MTKARILANLISDNAELADGQISVAEVVGAAPLASPTFTGTASGTFSGPLTGNVTGDLTGDVNTTLIASPTLNATVNIKTTDANGEGIGLGIDADKKVRFYDDQGSSTKMYWNASTVTQKFEDNSKLAFGSSENLKLYHDGTNKLVGDLTQTGAFTTDKYNNAEALPTVRPSLLLDFANSKTLDPRITFTRGSTATYWDGHTTTKAEENLLKYSQEFSNSFWANKGNTYSVTENATAPDGTTTASTWVANSTVQTETWIGFNDSSIVNSGETYTFSVYAKPSGFNWIVMNIGGSGSHYTYFDIANGNVGTVVGPSVTTNITSVGNGWYRCAITRTHSGSSFYGLQIYMADADGDATTTGNNSDGVLLWGAQLEIGNRLTAYTPTTSSPIVKYQPTLQTAASGEARFDHDPVTGESKGLLIEEARTNLVTYSEDFSVSAWLKGAASVQADNIVAPDGALYNDNTIRENSSNTEHLFYNGNSSPLGTNATFTMSVYAKNGAISPRRYIGLRNNSGTSGAMAVFDLQEGTVTDTNASGNYSVIATSIEDVGNGWYRCSVVMSDGGDGYREIRIQMVNSATPSYNTISSAPYQGDGVSTLMIWGAQMELGHGASSYIPTSGSTVTRSTDDASIALTNEVSLQEATVYAEAATYRAYANESAWCPVWQLNDGVSTANGVFDVRAYQVTHGTQAVINNGISGATALLKDSQTVTNGEFYKYGLFWNQGSVSFYKNGSLVNSATNQYANPVWDTLDIGWGDRGGRRLDGHIKKLSVYPQALSNNTMLAMTEE